MSTPKSFKVDFYIGCGKPKQTNGGPGRLFEHGSRYFQSYDALGQIEFPTAGVMNEVALFDHPREEVVLLSLYARRGD